MRFFLYNVGMAFLLGAPAFIAEARDDRLNLPIDSAMKEGRDKKVLGEDIKLVFGEAGPGGQELGTFTSNRKTNGVGKSDTEACNWAFLSAAKELQERARKEGGKAVVKIASVYKGAHEMNKNKFICGAGNIMAGVALEGTVVK